LPQRSFWHDATNSLEEVGITYADDGGEWIASCLARFTHGTHWIRGYVGPRASPDGMERSLNPAGLAKLTTEHTMKDQRVSTGIALLYSLFDVGDRLGGWMVNATLRPLYP